MKFLMMIAVFACSASFAQTPNPTPVHPGPHPHPAPAGAPVLVAYQASGYVPPKFSFQRHCELTVDGKLNGFLRTDRSSGSWAYDIPIARELDAKEFEQIREWISAAESGTMSGGPAACDIGSLQILATTGTSGKYYGIIDALDCNPRFVNTSDAAKSLVDWVGKNCHIQ